MVDAEVVETHILLDAGQLVRHDERPPLVFAQAVEQAVQGRVRQQHARAALHIRHNNLRLPRTIPPHRYAQGRRSHIRMSIMRHAIHAFNLPLTKLQKEPPLPKNGTQ